MVIIKVKCLDVHVKNYFYHNFLFYFLSIFFLEFTFVQKYLYFTSVICVYVQHRFLH